jgi:hypothetical protein
VLILVGAGLYLLQLIPMDPAVKQVIRVVVIVILVIYALLFLWKFFGIAALIRS